MYTPAGPQRKSNELWINRKVLVTLPRNIRLNVGTIFFNFGELPAVWALLFSNNTRTHFLFTPIFMRFLPNVVVFHFIASSLPPPSHSTPRTNTLSSSYSSLAFTLGLVSLTLYRRSFYPFSLFRHRRAFLRIFILYRIYFFIAY